MTIDATVQRVIDDALDEKGFGLGELKYLFRVKPDSEEFAAMFGSMYSECGRNPRDWVEKTEVNGLIKQRGTSHESLKKWMESEGFEMEPEGPSKIWGF